MVIGCELPGRTLLWLTTPPRGKLKPPAIAASALEMLMKSASSGRLFTGTARTAVSGVKVYTPASLWPIRGTTARGLVIGGAMLEGSSTEIVLPLMLQSSLYPSAITSGFDADGFGTQLKNNFSQYIGLNLSVPIFNRFQTRNNIRNARLEQENQQLQLDNTKKTLYKDIQQVYYNALNAQSKELSSQEAVNSSQDAFRLMQAKYENGKATITEFNESKNNYLKAESDLVQARYENIYQHALIEFYRGRELNF